METATLAAATPRYLKTSLRHFVSDATTDAELPADWTVEEATREISRALGLATVGPDNQPQYYELFLRRADGTAELLRPSTPLGDAVKDGDELAPMPEVVPGASRIG